MFHQEINKGQTTTELVSSLDPIIGKIICISRVHLSQFDAMINNDGSNNDEAGSLTFDGDSDGGAAVSIHNLPQLLTIWECPEMNLVTREEEGKVVSGWSCGYCPRPAQGPPKFHKHINATKAHAHVLKMKGTRTGTGMRTGRWVWGQI